MSASTDLTFALTHAIAFLTRSLIGRYSATTIDLLHFTLERNLTKLYENNWFPNEPQRGAGRRCLTLIPNGAPPRPVYFACKSARVNWSDWMSCLGNVETDVFIDPGCVSVRLGGINKTYIVWSAAAPADKSTESSPQKLTTAQSILDDDDENEIFNMIADEIRAPTWMTPILSQFPNVPRRSSITLPKLIIPTQIRLSNPSTTSTDSSLLSVGSGHSRSSSRSSLSDASGFSFSSVDSASTAATSFWSPASSKRSPAKSRPSPASARPSPKTSPKDTTLLLPISALIMQAPEVDVDIVDASEHVQDIPVMVTTPRGTRHTAAAQPPRVHIDTTKNEVTPYDGGKTTVLTGGVMLGMKPQAPSAPKLNPTTPRFIPTLAARQSNWRSVAPTPLRA